MALRLWIPLLLFALFTLGSAETANDNQLLNQIKEDVQFADHLTSTMKPLDFMKFLRTAAPKALSFISATLKFVNLIFSFLGNNESQVLLAIKQVYNEMNRRFDVIDNELLDIKRQLNWTRVSNQFSKTERDITTVYRLFKDIYEGPLAIRASQKSYFVHSFENTCTNCALDLYHGIMGMNKGLSDDILQTAMTSLQYNRPKMQTFMLGLLKLLVLAVNNELAYRKLQFSDANYLYTKRQWETRLHNVTTKMGNTNQIIKTKYHNQAESDITIFSSNYPKRSILSNQIFSGKLYDFLVKKYDWRDWMVTVYKPISANQYHSNHVCDGYVKYRINDRDIVVASVDQSQQPINTAVAQSVIDGIKTTYMTYGRDCAYFCVTVGSKNKRNANQVYSTFPRETKDCNIYASVGVIYSGYDPLYHSKPERLVNQSTPGENSYSIYFFR